MIQLADQHTRPFVRQIWKTVFDDSDAYMDLFFCYKYQDENTLVALEEGVVVASLQMLPYEITFWGCKIPFYYLAGLSTLPPYRGRGLMSQLILASHLLMRERQIPLSILVPAEEKLFAYYERFGYAQTFRKKERGLQLSLKDIWEKAVDEKHAYELFDSMYNRRNFCVQKNFSDFRTIIRQEIQEGFPPKENLSGMARVLDAPYLLDIYAKANPTNGFLMEVKDSLFGMERILIDKGSARPYFGDNNTDIFADERLLARLLFGFDTHMLNPPFDLLFPEQCPVMDYMLE
jgi:predicted N-acetyltransferase YhbS